MDHPEYIHIHQIFYDASSRAALDPAYLPLDNSSNERPDWYEFWPIRQFLRSTRLIADHWYGFLSPRFSLKTRITPDAIYQIVEQAHGSGSDVAIVSPGWAQLAYFRSVFEQGEFWHPGLMAACQAFVDGIGLKVKLGGLVTHGGNSGFSNYVVAKPSYWRLWLGLAEQLFAYIESGRAGRAAESTSYGSGIAPMKTFIQERLSTLILSGAPFRVAALDNSGRESLKSNIIFDENPMTRRALLAADFLKRKYVETGDASFLDSFEKIRAGIPVKEPYGDMLPWRRTAAMLPGWHA